MVSVDQVNMESSCKDKKRANENGDDLILLLCLYMWRFGIYNHIKREHVETIIQTVSFPFLIGLLD